MLEANIKYAMEASRYVFFGSLSLQNLKHQEENSNSYYCIYTLTKHTSKIENHMISKSTEKPNIDACLQSLIILFLGPIRPENLVSTKMIPYL